VLKTHLGPMVLLGLESSKRQCCLSHTGTAVTKHTRGRHYDQVAWCSHVQPELLVLNHTPPPPPAAP